MSLQGTAVVIIVSLCALYAAWLLMGATARRHVVAWLARGPWPAAMRRRLARANPAGSACGGCDGCDGATDKAKQAGPAIVQVHRHHP
ncbi:MAG TPA: hypothetical protein VFZ28_15565 [Burkholderiaceae bacterium]|nr:hypothetical protein [Burkholderiaceae bacterium]